MSKNLLIIGLASTLCAMPVMAQDQMYLIKDNHVVATHEVESVDYISFELPEGVINDPIWISVDNIGKNTVTYTVNTKNPNIMYAHGLVSWYDANLYALSYDYGEFDELDEATQKYLIKNLLYSVGYVGAGTHVYTQTDYEDDGTGYGDIISRFTVEPGTRYFLAVLEVDPDTQDPLDFMAIEDFSTLAPGQSPAQLTVTSLGQNGESLDFDITGSQDIVYCKTAYGMKNIMEPYVEVYGMDFLMNTFAEKYTLEELAQSHSWVAYDSGEYVLYVRGIDANGDIVDAEPAYATFTEVKEAGPEINILSKSKGEGSVSVNFEITPSNVEEAYVYLDKEDNVDDLLNDGWYLYEIASKSTATDITTQINNFGEYTFNSAIETSGWYTILIYAKDSDGNRTVARINFSTQEGSYWDIDTAAKIPALRKSPKFKSKAKSPVINRKK